LGVLLAFWLPCLWRRLQRRLLLHVPRLIELPSYT
jgi:hypothetical protein